MSFLTRRLKPFYEELLTPLTTFAQRLNLSPSAVTVGGFILACVGSYFLYLGNVLLGILFLILGAFADSIDGAIARRSNRVSPFGAFLDSTMDRFSDAAPFTALGLKFSNHADEVGVLLSFLALISSFGVSYTRARAESLGVQGLGGMFERTERWVVLILGLLTGFVKEALFIIFVGSTLTIIQRILETKRKLGGRL